MQNYRCAVAITRANLFDSVSGKSTPDTTIIIEGNRIISVGPDAQLKPPKNAQIIDAVGMVGVIVGIEHAVKPADTDVEQLLAEVGRRVDEHRRRPLPAFALDQHRTAPPPVLRVCGIACAPDIADAWHAAGRAAAKDGELEGHAAGTDAAARGTLLNRRKKLSVVARAKSSSLMPRTAASRFAVCTTLAGSLVCPRKGSGAR